ncbi:DUF1772 domain-containing protein [Spirosoma harenae]
MTSLPTLLLICATVTTALIAGLFYGYSCSVNPGLGRLSDVAYLSAMQSINKAILNPLFFVSFMGALVLLPMTTLQHYSQPITVRFWALLAATLIYLLGVFGITAMGNIPLNNMLESFSIQTASAEEMANLRARFEMPWNNWHMIRTVASVIALVLMVMACLSPKTE